MSMENKLNISDSCDSYQIKCKQFVMVAMYAKFKAKFVCNKLMTIVILTKFKAKYFLILTKFKVDT